MIKQELTINRDEFVKGMWGTVLNHIQEQQAVKFSRAEKIQQLHILYKDGSEYSVKNAYNIKVVKRKSGGFDIMYDYDFVVERNLPHGKERVEADKHVETTTGDVKAITLVGRRENGVRRTETIEFGGK